MIAAMKALAVISLIIVGPAALSEVRAQGEVELTADQQDAISWAEERGELLYRYDQAAWHGTDAFLKQFNADRDKEGMRSYIIMPGRSGALDAVFFGDFGQGLVEVARYAVDGNSVVSRNFLDPDRRPLLSATAVRLAEVRQIAIERLVSEELGLCAEAAPNTVVLPPTEDGTTEVYLLTPPTSSDSYPLGGHYRFEVGPDDAVVGWRRFLNTCFDLSMQPQTDDEGETVRPEMLFVTHLLDVQPTEIHYFASHYFPLPLMIGTTQNNLGWAIVQGQSAGAFEIGN